MESKLNDASCKLCGKNEKLCKAHIIPKALMGNKLTMFSMNNFPTNSSSTGSYDDGILCSLCDGALGELDNELKKFLDSITVDDEAHDSGVENLKLYYYKTNNYLLIN